MNQTPTTLPIHDNHFHCRPDGWKGMDAVREFMAAGGTSILHVRLPSYPDTVEAFEQTCRDHIAFGRQIAAETGCRVWSAIGPYPLEPMKIAEAGGREAGVDFGKACMDVAARLVAEGEAHCLGEIGRAHFDVPAEVQADNNELLAYGMQQAARVGCPVVLHTEHTTPDTMAEFAAMADAAGLARDAVIKHYCGPLVTADEHHGLVPSVIAGRSNIRKALGKDPTGQFLLETDYIDEPSRPNVVMPCDTVPKRLMGLLQNGELTEAAIHTMCDTLPRRLYGTPY